MEDFIVTKILKFIGRKLNGYKTIIGGVGFILTGVLGMIRIMFPDQTRLPDMTFQVDGVKDIALAISGGIVGFLRMSALSAPKTPDSSMTTTLSTSPAAEKN